MDIVNKLLSVIQSKDEIVDILNNINVYLEITYKTCCEKALSNTLLVDNNDKINIDSVLDFLNELLNTGHWSDVPLNIRHSYSCCSFIKVQIKEAALRINLN